MTYQVRRTRSHEQPMNSFRRPPPDYANMIEVRVET